MTKNVSKYITAFNYFDKTLIILFAGRSFISLTNVIGISVGIANGSFILAFSLTAGIIKKLFTIARNKKNKSN